MDAPLAELKQKAVSAVHRSKNLRPLEIDQVQREDVIGSGRGTRTPDPWIMIPLLYQLSYAAT